MQPAGDLRVLVVDDEAPAREELVHLLRESPGVATVGAVAGAEDCLRALQDESYDALFVDIRMPGLDGLALAGAVHLMSPVPAIVFVTAHEEHALDAFGLGAVDYLLKPVRPERLQVTLGRLRHLPAAAAKDSSRTQRLEDRLPVVGRNSILLLPLDEVRVVVSDGEGVGVVTAGQRYATRLGMGELEARLPHHAFLRVHRRYIVNLRHVSSIETFFNGTYLLKLDDVKGLTVPVSRRHARQFRNIIRF